MLYILISTSVPPCKTENTEISSVT